MKTIKTYREILEAKYIPNMKYDPTKYHKQSDEEFGNDIIQLADMFCKTNQQKDVTRSIGLYIKKGNKKNVKKLLTKFSKDICLDNGTINEIYSWLERN